YRLASLPATNGHPDRADLSAECSVRTIIGPSCRNACPIVDVDPPQEASMIETDRVAVVGWIWFIAWILVGHAAGRWIGDPGTMTVVGFFCAIVTLPAWPWLLPQRLDDWMHDLPVDSGRHYRHLWLPSWHAPYATSEGRHAGRVAIVGAFWFLFWM